MNNVEQFKRIALELCNLYEAKDKCYNNSFGDTYKKLGIISAVTRISDKFNRLCNLATNPDIDNLGESLEDTLRDMASYCIMTAMELENAKPILDMRGNVIKKGDRFECIKTVVMDDGEIVYNEGYIYTSDYDGCITDNQNDKCYVWQDNGDDCSWINHFKRI